MTTKNLTEINNLRNLIGSMAINKAMLSLSSNENILISAAIAVFEGKLKKLIADNTEIEIIPSDSSVDITENDGRLGYTYLHGQLEHEVGFDIFYIKDFKNAGFKRREGNTSYIDEDKTKSGTYTFTHNGKAGTLFLWVINEGGLMYKGLAVYDDKESYGHAKKKYAEKSSLI